MKFLKEYKIPVIMILVLLVAVLLKQFFSTSYQVDAEDMPGLISEENIFYDQEQMGTARQENILLLNFMKNRESNPGGEYFSIPIGKGDNYSFRLIRILKDTVRIKVILADDITEAVQIWTLLRQLGSYPLYILDQSDGVNAESWKNNERFNYTFLPDTTLFNQDAL